jgi:hypothetical protein
MFSKLIVIAAALLVIGVGAASATPTELGMRADGLRLQGLADRYAYLQGVKADGLRWQALNGFYADKAAPTVTPADGFDWRDAGMGAGAALAALAIGGTAVIILRRSRGTKLAV